MIGRRKKKSQKKSHKKVQHKKKRFQQQLDFAGRGMVFFLCHLFSFARTKKAFGIHKQTKTTKSKQQQI